MRALRIAELAMFDMTQEDSPPPDDLYSALRDIVYRPVQNACAAMELECSSTQRFAARDHVFRR
jgi:hypothetical protein